MSCVEQGRWRHTLAHFSVGTYALPQMRNKKSRRVSASYKASGQAISDQGEVWQDVEAMVCSLKAHSATHAMKDAFDQRADDFGSFVKARPYPNGAREMLAAVSGRFVAMDALDSPEAFKCVWNRLLSGYAVDAIGRAEADAKPFGEKSARFILDSLSECRVSAFKAVGLGQELRFESDVMLGQALAVDDGVVHISVFPKDSQGQRDEDGASHIMPPSFRRRPHSEE